MAAKRHEKALRLPAVFVRLGAFSMQSVFQVIWELPTKKVLDLTGRNGVGAAAFS